MRHHLRTIILSLLVAMTCLPSSAVETDEPNISFPSDSIAMVKNDVAEPIRVLTADSYTDPDRDWWHLLKQGELSLSDTTVVYPRFAGFCVKVYNWADKFFNSTDTAYVQGTGRRWKAFVKSDNWVDSYAMNMQYKMRMRMTSDIYCGVGAYIQYMAVSVGYMLDMSNIIGNRPDNHRKLEFSFSCARFSADLYYHINTGGSYIRTFGDYKHGHIFKKEFPGLTLHNYGFDAYYFINNRRYSQGAAYSFSKFQRRTAGSMIAGFSYSNLDIALDLAQLPESLLPFLTIPAQKYKFHYNTYNLMIGYGINVVPRSNWVLNFTATPMIGININYEDSADGKAQLLALGVKGKMAAVYNAGDFFAGVNAHFDGHWYKSGSQSFFSSIENMAAVLGVRF